jgi:hypothetical protein
VPTIDFKLGGTLTFVTEAERAGAMITLRYDGFSITAWGTDMAYTLPNDHQVQVKITYVDAKGHPAAVDGVVTWTSSNENVATVTADSADSTLATIVPGADVGQVQIVARGDADLGEGVREIITPMDVTVVGGEAVAGTISPVGEATPIEP